jgi:acylphosphatase
VVAKRVVVHGGVQGVGFRVSAASRARTRGVAGWVRNRPDGTVEVVLEGPPDAVDALVLWCSEGPRGATVTHVDVSDTTPEGLASFEIR